MGSFSTCNRPITVTGLSVWVAGEWWSISGEPNYHWNALKHGEILPDPSKIPSDPARFLANRDEKSLVQLDPVFIVPKIEGFK